MENNYEFWENYLIRVKKELKKICKNKTFLYIDLHIHSEYSADGKQSIKQIIKSTKEKGFDVIAITDHDSVNAYDELYEYVKNDLTTPIIIPGVEFTTDNVDYGNQCHILQLFINPKDNILTSDVEKNYKATFNRSKLQFKRLKKNKAIQEIIKKYKIKISYNEYIKYLEKNIMVPEYDTLSYYLMDKLKQHKVKTFDVLKLLEKYNELDCYKDRAILKSNRYEKLKRKYPYIENNYYNPRFLLSLLAVKEVDDDWWQPPSSGSLSVNSYGQLKINELNDKYKTFFAHPTENKLAIVEEIIKTKESIIGIELNKRNEYSNINNFNQLLTITKKIKIIGSDSHDDSLSLYNDMEFYKISSEEFRKVL